MSVVPARELNSADEIGVMVREFYERVQRDDLLGPMFNDVAQVDWEEHLPKLTRFWCRALLSEPGYQGNPFRSHQRVNVQEPFTAAHFLRWLSLFRTTIESRWTGPNADAALAFAQKVARVHCKQIVGVELEL